MKKPFYLLFAMLLMLFSNSMYAQDFNPKEAWTKISSVVELEDSDYNVSISKSGIQPSSQIKTLSGTISSPDFGSWLFFVDCDPTANWGHKCIYVFFNPVSGKFVSIDGNMPPEIPLERFITSPKRNNTVNKAFNNNKNNLKTITSEYQSAHNYAVIISGGGYPEINGIRFWNDCSFINLMGTNIY